MKIPFCATTSHCETASTHGNAQRTKMPTIMNMRTASQRCFARCTSPRRNIRRCNASSRRAGQASHSLGALETNTTRKSGIQRLNATDQDKDNVSSSSSKSTSSRGEKASKPQKSTNQKPQSMLSQVFGNQLPIMAFVGALTLAAYKGMVLGQDGPEKVLMAPSVMAVILLVSFFGWRMMAELRKR